MSDIIRIRNWLFFKGILEELFPLFDKYLTKQDTIFATRTELAEYLLMNIENENVCFLIWRDNKGVNGYCFATLEKRELSKTREVVLWQTCSVKNSKEKHQEIFAFLEKWGKEMNASIIRFDTADDKVMQRILSKFGFKKTISIFEKIII
jgi:hypothetical protein